MLWYFITESIFLCATLFYRFSARAMLVGNLISNWPANLMSTSILSFPTSHVRWWSWRWIIESNTSFGKARRMFDHYRVFTEQVVSRSMAWTLLWESRNLSLLTQSHNCSDSTPPTTSWHGTCSLVCNSCAEVCFGVMLFRLFQLLGAEGRPGSLLLVFLLV